MVFIIRENMGIFGEMNAIASLGEKGYKIGNFLKKKSNPCDDYYYDEYNKKVFIRKNGDGVIVSSCILKVIDPIKTDHLIRTLDIGDAKEDSRFEKFEIMRAKSLENVFSEYGFWYKSDNDIITDVEEYYEDEDTRRRDDGKFISIKMLLDTTKLEKGNTYKIMYAFSVPGLFPILDGRFDYAGQDRSNYPDFRSYISTSHIGHHLRFAVYFEEGIELKEKPSGNAKLSSAVKRNKKNSVKTHNCIFKDNVFYKKYYFEIENPQEYTDIYMKWNIKNPAQISKV